MPWTKAWIGLKQYCQSNGSSSIFFVQSLFIYLHFEFSGVLQAVLLYALSLH